MQNTVTTYKLRVAACWLTISLAMAGLGYPVWAQDSIRGHLDAGVLTGFPQGEFKRNVNQMGYGVGGSGAGYISQRAPLAIGLSLGYLTYGSESRKEPFSSTIPDVTVEVTTTNSILLGHFLLRLQPRDGTLRPYLEGMAGFNYLFTKTKIIDVGDDEEIASSTNLDDLVFSYGFRSGLMIEVYEGVERDDDGDDEDAGSRGAPRTYSVSLDLGVSYLPGGEASYLKKGSIRRSDDRVAYDIIRSKTDLITAHIGITLSR